MLLLALLVAGAIVLWRSFRSAGRTGESRPSIVPTESAPDVRGTPSPAATPIGYSGMARIDQATFVVVHDTKARYAGARLGTLTVLPKKAPAYTPVEVDWGPDPANDLEAIYALPGRDREFLAMESGYHDGKFGRIFHLAVTGDANNGWRATVAGTIPLPADTDDLEGLACVTSNTGLLVLLGERGGSERNPRAKIRLCRLDLTAHRLELVGEQNLAPPTSITAGQTGVRGCADLYIDERNQLWSVATQDLGDEGPFRSVVYQAGTVDPAAAEPLQILPETTAMWTLDGIKVEALSASAIENSALSIATDDESYDGIWRPLFAPAGSMPPP